MDYPEINERVLHALTAAGFDGMDASLRISLFEYGGVYHERTSTALLVETDTRDPGISFEVITPDEVNAAISDAGPGFSRYIGRDAVVGRHGADGVMEMIQALMLYNGGWHRNSDQWLKLSEYTCEELLQMIDQYCNTRLSIMAHLVVVGYLWACPSCSAPNQASEFTMQVKCKLCGNKFYTHE
jgi:hypothetical protein